MTDSIEARLSFLEADIAKLFAIVNRIMADAEDGTITRTPLDAVKDYLRISESLPDLKTVQKAMAEMVLNRAVKPTHINLQEFVEIVKRKGSFAMFHAGDGIDAMTVAADIEFVLKSNGDMQDEIDRLEEENKQFEREAKEEAARADAWCKRFTALQHDMDGTMEVLDKIKLERDTARAERDNLKGLVGFAFGEHDCDNGTVDLVRQCRNCGNTETVMENVPARKGELIGMEGDGFITIKFGK